MSPHFGFPSRLRIKSRKDVELLFENGRSLFSHPLILKFEVVDLPKGSNGLIQVAVSIPKKLFRKAHDRNTLKRRIREAYRLNWQNYLSAIPEKKILMMFILVVKKECDYAELEKSTKQLLEKLKSFIENPSD